MAVVSYRNSTSNHNTLFRTAATLLVVSYRNSTSNHNKSSPYVNKPELYLIEILHQTTTRTAAALISIGCILSKFYIKPQLSRQKASRYRVVSYRNSTSNHNSRASKTISAGVVSYRNSTSNHNFLDLTADAARLYLIEILHQTTTSLSIMLHRPLLYLIEILHQTTTMRRVIAASCGCILSKFYIKPQLPGDTLDFSYVVSYRNSTSNHNNPRYLPNRKNVVSYRNSTSNHN